MTQIPFSKFCIVDRELAEEWIYLPMTEEEADADPFSWSSLYRKWSKELERASGHPTGDLNQLIQTILCNSEQFERKTNAKELTNAVAKDTCKIILERTTMMVVATHLVVYTTIAYHFYLTEHICGVHPQHTLEHVLFTSAGLTIYNNHYMSKHNLCMTGTLNDELIRVNNVNELMATNDCSATEKSAILAWYKGAVHGIHSTETIRFISNTSHHDISKENIFNAFRRYLIFIATFREMYAGAYTFELVIHIHHDQSLAIRNMLSTPFREEEKDRLIGY